MIDPIVHASLVAVFAWLVKLAANALGFDLTESTYTEIAGLVVAYILSLFGYSLWVRASAKSRGLTADEPEYIPPFT